MYIEPPIDISCDYQGQVLNAFLVGHPSMPLLSFDCESWRYGDGRSSGLCGLHESVCAVLSFLELHGFARRTCLQALNLASVTWIHSYVPTQILTWISMNVTHAMNLRSAIFK